MKNSYPLMLIDLRREPSRRAAVLILCLVLIASQSVLAAAKTRRVKFKAGETKTRVVGRLNGWNDRVSFVIRVRAGQTMRLSAEGKCDACYPYIDVDAPRGDTGDVDRDMCGCRVEVTNTAAGDYRITISENRKGDAWKGEFNLDIEVK